MPHVDQYSMPVAAQMMPSLAGLTFLKELSIILQMAFTEYYREKHSLSKTFCNFLLSPVVRNKY
jgi:hypothetical protein